MAQERLGMREAREILRLKLELGRSDTEIAISVRRARSTVADCVARARAQALTAWSVVAVLSEIELEGLRTPRRACRKILRAGYYRTRGCSSILKASRKSSHQTI
ncbi:MAG: hypothetical protein HY459_02545 [Parcubacteria group bacterium]|nr:hypothetical protein [Parcubacteria group bacterium]